MSVDSVPAPAINPNVMGQNSNLPNTFSPRAEARSTNLVSYSTKSWRRILSPEVWRCLARHMPYKQPLLASCTFASSRALRSTNPHVFRNVNTITSVCEILKQNFYPQNKEPVQEGFVGRQLRRVGILPNIIKPVEAWPNQDKYLFRLIVRLLRCAPEETDEPGKCQRTLKELLAVAAGLNSRHFLLDEIIKFCKNKNFNEFSVFPYVVLAARGEKISTIMEMWDLSSSCSEVRRLLECIALCSPRVRHAIVADEEPDRIIEKYGFILEGSKETIKKMALPKNKDLIENLRLEINPDFSIENSDFSVGECHDRPNGSISIVLIPYLEPRQREEDPRTVSGFGGCVNNEGRAHIHALTAQLSYPDSILKEEQIREILKPAFEAR